ncbi:MAG: alkaline phosphatase family protein [Chitinophagaceae bacterium]|nr:MAG: alkaline phosphatase family protein [Chitinophagaceae bacterium]
MRIVFVLLMLIVHAALAQDHVREKKAVFVIVDGISADVIEKIATPALDSIAAVGGYARAYVGGEKDGYSQTPTVSAVGYNSLLTGTWANKHNVWDNDIAAPNYAYPTIFRLFKEQYPDRKTAVFSSWLDNRTKLVGDGLPAAGNQNVDYKYDSLEYDTVHFAHDRSRDFMHRIDEAVVDSAAKSIRLQAPDLSWVYLEYTDDMGHMYGDSEQFYRAVRLMDNQMSRLWEAIRFREAKYNEDWVIYITTDHGRSANNGKGHGGQTDRERSTWIVTNDDSLNSYFKSGNAAIVDIMPSLAAHLDVKLPTHIAYEIDGVKLNGPVSAVDLRTVYRNGKLIINWKTINPAGEAVIKISQTNKFKSGGKDEYRELKRVPVKNGTAEIEMKSAPFYKVVVEFPYNILNRWVIDKK